MRLAIGTTLALTLVGLPAAQGQVQELDFYPGLDVSAGSAVPGGGASKAKLLQLEKTPGGVNDGRLVTVYGDHNGPVIWEPKGGEHPAHDLFFRYSDDDGYTWSKPVNLSNTANTFSSSTDWDGDGTTEPYWGDSEKPNIFANGNNIVVTWIDKYCPQSSWSFGDSGQSAVQGQIGYADLATFPNTRNVPYAGVYAAVSTDGGTTWSFGDQNPPLQLTYGRRDAKQDVNKGIGPRWLITWQEDPEGLQKGGADGPGDGSSGANTTRGTDIWYTWTADLVNDALALRNNRTPLSNHSEYDMTGVDGFPTVGNAGSVENHAGSRANTFLLNEGGTFKALIAYEETKGLPDLLDGKTVQYHAFTFNQPIVNGADNARSGAPGTTLTNILQNARRVRFVAQPPNGVVPAICIFWRQGTETEGGPGDIMVKTALSADEASVAAAPTLNLSTNTPNATPADLFVDPTADPLEDARAHRAYMRDDFIAVGYTYTFNGPLARYTDLANYDFWMRRSFDGGLTWDAPFNVSNLPTTKVNVKEPRLVGPSKTGTQNDGAFLLAWGTETNVYEGLQEIEPLDLQITRTLDFGATYAPVTYLADTLGGEFESQLRIAEDGSEVYAVWMETRNGQTAAMYATGKDPNPVRVTAVNEPVDPGATVQLEFVAPGHAGELVIGAASFGFNPGIVLPSTDIVPLNPDALFTASLTNPGAFLNFSGLMGLSELHSASLPIPADAALSGLRFYVAFIAVALDGTNAGFSNPELVEIR